MTERLTLEADQFALLQWAAAADSIPLGEFPIRLQALACLIGDHLVEARERRLFLTDRGIRFLSLCVPDCEGGASAPYDSLPREPWGKISADRTSSGRGFT